MWVCEGGENEVVVVVVVRAWTNSSKRLVN